MIQKNKFSNNNNIYALVSILSLKINEPYFYSIHSEFENFDLVGCRVIVEVKNRQFIGIIISLHKDIDENLDKDKIKPVIKILDTKPYINAELLNLANWMSNYYFTPLGKVLNIIFPSGTNFRIIKKLNVIKNPIKLSGMDILLEKNSYKFGEITKLLKIKKSKILELIQRGFLKIEYQLVTRKTLEKKEYFTISILNEQILDSEEELKILNWIKNNHGKIFNKKNFNNEIPFKKNLINKFVKNNIIRLDYCESDYIRKYDSIKDETDFILTDEQLNVITKISESIEKNIFKSFLLFGVTGSGKTEIYIRLIKEILKRGKNAIIIVPEIALTPQILNYFSAHFSRNRIAVIHSGLNNSDRFREWEKIRYNKIDIVLGVRSAIFAPLENIGIIIVDEEHEESFKNQEMPTYNARDIAVMRAKKNNAVALLGTATPSLESYYNTIIGKYELLRLTQRVFKKAMPDISIIDLNKTSSYEKEKFISYRLLKEIKNSLDKNRQVLLFLNKRGYSHFVICTNCQKIYKCVNCDITMTYHKENNSLICHYCNYTIKNPETCDVCGSNKLLHIGAGTEKIFSYLEKNFKDKKILRVDIDSMRFKDSYQNFYNQFKKKEIDIIIGTQIITKGHDFPGIDLVGIINADLSLNIPDYRSAERTFSLLMQASGRTGRQEEEIGKVIIQTFNPEHYSIKAVCNYDYEKFFETELEIRKKFRYTPFIKMIIIEFKGKNSSRVSSEIEKLKQEILKSEIRSELIVLGPAKGLIPRINNFYIFKLLIKSNEIKYLQYIYQKFIFAKRFYSKIKIEI